MFDRMEPMPIDPREVLVLGCRTGADVPPLEKRFRGARILGADRSMRMLRSAAGRRRWRARSDFVRCDPRALPLADRSVDLVYSNLSLAAVDDPAPVAAAIARVLRADGLFVFATLGPDSLGELRRAWAAVDDDPHVQRFLDMHDLGDLLVRAGLRDPVLDVDRLHLDYAGSAGLFRDLTVSAARNVLAGRRRSLTGRARFGRMTEALEKAAQGKPIRVGLELVYGHCWGSGGKAQGADVRIDPASISLRRQRR
jgi:malonyl-CoA O-methyltransferase